MRLATKEYGRIPYDKFIYLFIFILALVLFGGNTYNPDYNAYEYSYYSLIKDSHTDAAVYVLQSVFRKLGFSFQFFRLIEAAIGLYLINKTLKYYTSKPLFPFVLYLIYPFLLDVVQVRNFLSYTIVLFSLRFLDEEFHKGAKKYFIGVLIASQFHVLSIAYLLFLLVYLKKMKKIVVVSVVIAVVVLLSANILPQYVQYLPIIGKHSQQISYYLSFNDTYKNGAATYALLLIVYFGMYYYKVCRHRKDNANNDEVDNKRTSYDTLLKLMALSLCFVPLILINSEFVRLIRNMWMLYYIGLGQKMDRVTSEEKIWHFRFKLFAILLAFFLFYKELSPYSYYYERVTKTIIENNMLW